MKAPAESAAPGTMPDWLHRGQPVPVRYPDRTGAILDQLLAEQLGVPRPREAVRAL